jgi:hypothetical protein
LAVKAGVARRDGVSSTGLIGIKVRDGRIEFAILILARRDRSWTGAVPKSVWQQKLDVAALVIGPQQRLPEAPPSASRYQQQDDGR